MSGKRAFLDVLKQEGVEIMFGNPGTTELPLMDAFATENELRYLLGLQEAAVMAMADGYAQASGKLAVVNLHVTPGLGNAMGMLYDAQKAANPKFKIGCVSEPSWEGVVALRTAMKLLSGQDVPKRQIISPVLMDGSNYSQFIKKDLPDGVFVDTLLTDDELKKLFS